MAEIFQKNEWKRMKACPVKQISISVDLISVHVKPMFFQMPHRIEVLTC